MNRPKDIEQLYKIKDPSFSMKNGRYTYNPNNYLNLDFNTLDNISFEFKIYENLLNHAKVPDYNYDLEEGIKKLSVENFDHDFIELLSVTFDISCHKKESIYNDIKKMEAISEHIRETINKDLEEYHVYLENIEEGLLRLRERKEFLENYDTAYKNITANAKFIERNYASFEDDELEVYIKKLKKTWNDNQEYLTEDGVSNYLSTEAIVKNIYDNISYSTKAYINTKKEQDIESKYASKADQLIAYNIRDNSVSKFLVEKILENDIKFKLSFEKNSINKAIYLMNDESILVQKRDGTYSTIHNDQGLSKLLDEIVKDTLNAVIINKPTITSYIMKMYKEEGSAFNDFEIANSLANTIKNSEQILKNLNINFMNMSEKGLEELDDYLSEQITTYKVQKFMHKILSNKYKFLIDENTEQYMRELYNIKLTDAQLQDYVGKKLAALRDPKDLTKMLEKLFNQMNGFSPEIVIDKLNELGIKPVIKEEELMVFEVSNYAECVKMGSSSWCIHRDESFFKRYVTEGSKQFIMYDFSKDSKDKFSIIGFTMKENGSLSAQHLKNDDHVDFNHYDYLKNIYHKIALEVVPVEKMSERLKAIYDENQIQEKSNKQKLGIA